MKQSFYNKLVISGSNDLIDLFLINLIGDRKKFRGAGSRSIAGPVSIKKNTKEFCTDLVFEFESTGGPSVDLYKQFWFDSAYEKLSKKAFFSCPSSGLGGAIKSPGRIILYSNKFSIDSVELAHKASGVFW
jgi:hypothetical protein